MFYKRAGSYSHQIVDDFSSEYDTFNPTPLSEKWNRVNDWRIFFE